MEQDRTHNPFILLILFLHKHTMKKFFALAAMAAMFIACGGEKPNPQPQPQPGPGEGDEQVESAIKVDGQFDDWAALDASKVVSVALNEEEGTYKYSDLKLVKVYADELSINLYVEFDPIQAMNFGLFIDADFDETTGRNTPWCGVELYFEGSIYEWLEDETGAFVEQLGGVAWTPGLFQFAGADNTDEWNWTELVAGGIATASTPAAVGELAAVEISVMREMIAYDLAETVGLGFTVANNGWNNCGVLPQVSTEAEETGEVAHMLEVALP